MIKKKKNIKPYFILFYWFLNKCVCVCVIYLLSKLQYYLATISYNFNVKQITANINR